MTSLRSTNYQFLDSRNKIIGFKQFCQSTCVNCRLYTNYDLRLTSFFDCSPCPRTMLLTSAERTDAPKSKSWVMTLSCSEAMGMPPSLVAGCSFQLQLNMVLCMRPADHLLVSFGEPQILDYFRFGSSDANLWRRAFTVIGKL